MNLNIEKISNNSFIKGFDVEKISRDQVHDKYFNWAQRGGLNISSGIVGTPRYIANYMVAETVRTVCKPLDSISWLDPCCGSGVFVESILTMYLESEFFDRSILTLPVIHAIDNSPEAINCTLLVVSNLLKKYNIDIEDYINSRKFKLFTEDTLFKINETASGELLCYDVVIGNPPYVRSTRLKKEYKEKLKKMFSSSCSLNNDLHHYFIVSGLISLKENGVLSFISPPSFLKAASSLKMRKYLESNSEMIRFLDLDELPIFSGASTHSSIYWIQKTTTDGLRKSNMDYAHLLNNDELLKLKTGNIEFENVERCGSVLKGWFFNINKTDDLLASEDMITLKKAGVKIFSGVRPGLKRAFVYSKDQLLSLNEETIREWFSPCVESRDVNRWKTDHVDKYLLLANSKDKMPPKEITELLAPFKEILEKRHEVKDEDYWYLLRPCSYYEIFNSPKIIYPDICIKPRFCLDPSSRVVIDGAFIIQSSSLALLGVLNSTIAWDYFKNHCMSIGNVHKRGRLRLKKNYLEEFPVPISLFEENDLTSPIIKTVKNIIKEGESEKLLNDLNVQVKCLYGEI